MANHKKGLTEEQIKWLIKHFKHTRNEEIQKRLGIGSWKLNSLAKELGLKKSKQYMKGVLEGQAKKMRNALMEKARTDHEWWEQQMEMRNENLARYRHKFKPGESNKTRLSEERFKEVCEKSRESRNALIKRERARQLLGLKPLTRMAIGIPTKERTAMQHRKYCLRTKYGYICPKVGRTIYYDSNTKRSTREAWYERTYKMRFVDINSLEPKERVVIVPDWDDKQGGFNI